MRIIDTIENNSVICFFGDSITASGIWESEIFSYLSENHKEKQLKLYNCGIGGDNSGEAIKRLYKDCLSLSPDYVVLMFGMNDINRPLYINDNEENVVQRQEHIDKYIRNMTEIMTILANHNIKVIACTPTICGYIPEGRTDVGNVTPGLKACADFVRDFAEKDGHILIDFNEPMWKYAKSEEPIISQDCVHPTEYGYHIMAQLFMVQMGMKDEVDLTPYIEKNPKNVKRFDTEKIITYIRFCEYAMQWSGCDVHSMTVEDRKNWIKQYGNPKTAPYWSKEITDVYLKCVDFREECMAELVELTYAMSKN